MLLARTDALVGLVADAVGAGDLAEARRRLVAAAAEVDRCAGLAGRAGWRPAVRLAWVRAEVALLAGDGAGAVIAAEPAVAQARAARAPRHVTKSLLVLGVAEQTAGRTADAVRILRQAAGRAERLGLLPLIWPARLVLSYALDRIRPEAASHELAAAVLAICELLMPLPPAEAATLLARPDIRPLVETYLKSRS